MHFALGHFRACVKQFDKSGKPFPEATKGLVIIPLMARPDRGITFIEVEIGTKIFSLGGQLDVKSIFGPFILGSSGISSSLPFLLFEFASPVVPDRDLELDSSQVIPSPIGNERLRSGIKLNTQGRGELLFLQVLSQYLHALPGLKLLQFFTGHDTFGP